MHLLEARPPNIRAKVEELTDKMSRVCLLRKPWFRGMQRSKRGPLLYDPPNLLVRREDTHFQLTQPPTTEADLHLGTCQPFHICQHGRMEDTLLIVPGGAERPAKLSLNPHFELIGRSKCPSTVMTISCTVLSAPYFLPSESWSGPYPISSWYLAFLTAAVDRRESIDERSFHGGLEDKNKL